jgi:universal stress protein A
VDFLDQTMLVDINLDEMLLKNAKKQLQELCAQFGVPENRVHLKIGAVKTEVFEIIEATKTDCLIVGSHGRHGLGLLLGSTANSLLHGSQCDVLAVRIKD